MPRYFFHIDNGGQFPDNDGTVLDDTADAVRVEFGQALAHDAAADQREALQHGVRRDAVERAS